MRTVTYSNQSSFVARASQDAKPVKSIPSCHTLDLCIDALMVKAWPTFASDEFAEACQQLEANAFGRLDGTNWLSLAWDERGALHVRKHIEIQEQKQKNGEVQIAEESDVIEPEDTVRILRSK